MPHVMHEGRLVCSVCKGYEITMGSTEVYETYVRNGQTMERWECHNGHRWEAPKPAEPTPEPAMELVEETPHVE